MARGKSKNQQRLDEASQQLIKLLLALKSRDIVRAIEGLPDDATEKAKIRTVAKEIVNLFQEMIGVDCKKNKLRINVFDEQYLLALGVNIERKSGDGDAIDDLEDDEG